MKFSCVKHVNCSKSAGVFFLVLFAALLCYHRLLLFDFTLFSEAIEMRVVQYYVTFFRYVVLFISFGSFSDEPIYFKLLHIE